MMNNIPPFDLMTDETKDRFFRSGFTAGEIETLSHARKKEGNNT